MTSIQCGLPVALLVLVFLFRLLIDRRISVTDFIFSILELPQSIAFLGVSLIVAFTIISKENVEIGLLTLMVYLVIAVIVVFLWRRAVRYFERDRLLVTILLGVISYALAVPSLFYSVVMVIEGG